MRKSSRYAAYLPFVLVAVIGLVYHAGMKPMAGDDIFSGCHKRHDAVGVSDAALSDLDIARGVGVCTGQCHTVPAFVENH